jgi:hypothetical protein
MPPVVWRVAFTQRSGDDTGMHWSKIVLSQVRLLSCGGVRRAAHRVVSGVVT